MKLSQENLKKLVEAENYRAFMALWIEIRAASKKFGFSDIARIGGFAARSFPREVLSGKKRITPKSLTKFKKGLGLQDDLADYFSLLVGLEHPDCRPEGSDAAETRRLLRSLRRRIQERSEKDQLPPDSVFQGHDVPEVYAALGTEEKGATLAEIRSRTSLKGEDIRASLDWMLKIGVAKRIDNRYLPVDSHLSFERLKTSGAFQKYFIRKLELASEIAGKGLDSDEKLFFASTFSVHRKDLPKMKDALREVLLKYVDKTERASGDRVVTMVASLF